MKKSLFSDVKRRVTMKDVLHHYVDDAAMKAYRQKGDQLRGPCILCGGGNQRSLSINTKKQCYRTFCCGSQGNIFDLVSDKELASVAEACQLLAQRFGIDEKPPEEEAQQSEAGNKPLSFALKNLDPDHEALSLLEISQATLEHFEIGYYSGRGLFKGHVVVPVYNLEGQLVAYSGAPVVESNLGKWCFPEQFQASYELFHGHWVCKQPKDSRETLILVPEIINAVRLFDLGYQTVVASMGDTPSQSQIALLEEIGGGHD